MDREKNITYIGSAESALSSVRSSLLILAQTCDSSDISDPRGVLARIASGALDIGQDRIAELASDCDLALDALAAKDIFTPAEVYTTLDIVAKIEAALFEIPFDSNDLLTDISELVDASFDELLPHDEPGTADDRQHEEFEIDEETLDIFRTEADDLLANIGNSLRVLSLSPADQAALWEIRRNAHTFKGAAGIIGLHAACEAAHRMEDLLDKMVEQRLEAAPQVIEYLDCSAERLNNIVRSKDFDREKGDLEAAYANAMAWLAAPNVRRRDGAPGAPVPDAASGPQRDDIVKVTTTPIVRVSLDRLDELIKVSRSLIFNRSALAERFGQLSLTPDVDAESLAKVEALFETQRHLTDEIQSKLLKIRMVKFGTLETRLSRAVHVTSLDENKKSVLELENADVEIDTQVIDALIEPLLHLLKNAVVHGIELPDTRRLIGKPERGTVRVRLEADDEALVLSVSDDGSGISALKLKDKAVANRIIDTVTAASMTDREAMRLIFDRGLTTAEKIDLNAGRGVGMSIVKESVEARGGTVLVESEPLRGTTFTILMPLAVAKTELVQPEPETPVMEPLPALPPLVLIVDDSASVRHQSTRLIEDAGLRVITTNNGAEALELLLNGEWEPDLILSDIEMPQIDGWELLEYVKTDDNFGHIPVAMVSSLNADEHRSRAMELGALDYIVKPFDRGDLNEILEKTGIAAAISEPAAGSV